MSKSVVTHSIPDPESPGRAQKARIDTIDTLVAATPDSNALLSPLLISRMSKQGSDFWFNIFPFMYDLFVDDNGNTDKEATDNRAANSVQDLRYLCKTFATALPIRFFPESRYIEVVGLNDTSIENMSESDWEGVDEPWCSNSFKNPIRTMQQALALIHFLREPSLHLNGKQTCKKKRKKMIINEIHIVEGTIGEMDWLTDWTGKFVLFILYCFFILLIVNATTLPTCAHFFLFIPFHSVLQLLLNTVNRLCWKNLALKLIWMTYELKVQVLERLFITDLFGHSQVVPDTKISKVLSYRI